MKTYKINADLGDMFSQVAVKAKNFFIDTLIFKGFDAVEFEFNGITCLVNEKTNIEYLYRDYYHAHDLGWTTVGFDCVKFYGEDIINALKVAETQRENTLKEMREKRKAEQRKQEEALSESTKEISIELSNETLWLDYVEKNTDPYGKACVNYAEAWAKLMQKEIANGKTVFECADKTSNDADIEGITGFMYGAAISMLSSCWKHGEDLRKWHNKEYGHEGDGVVNPALLTIKSK